MESIEIQVTPELKKYIEEKALKGGYKNLSEFVNSLIYKDLVLGQMPNEEELLLEGLHSGDPTPMTDDEWNTLGYIAKNRNS